MQCHIVFVLALGATYNVNAQEEEPFTPMDTCTPPAWAVELFCSDATKLINALGSKLSLLTDAIGITCSSLSDSVYEMPGREYFFQALKPFDLWAPCPGENEIITKFRLCISDGKPMNIYIQCNKIKPVMLEHIAEKWDTDNLENNRLLTSCSSNAGTSAMLFKENPDCRNTTVVTFKCIRFD